MGVRAISLVPNGVGPNSACKSPFIKCINHYSLNSLINFHFSSDTDGVKCVHGSALTRRGNGLTFRVYGSADRSSKSET